MKTIDFGAIISAIIVCGVLLWVFGSFFQYAFCGYAEVGSLGWLILKLF